jgi:hypothetical protein
MYYKIIPDKRENTFASIRFYPLSIPGIIYSALGSVAVAADQVVQFFAIDCFVFELLLQFFSCHFFHDTLFLGLNYCLIRKGGELLPHFVKKFKKTGGLTPTGRLNAMHEFYQPPVDGDSMSLLCFFFGLNVLTG